MSDVKRDPNLGRKVKSGASERKIKAELESKNLELSESLLKIFKSHEDASVIYSHCSAKTE
jgi:hypothetical protein